MAFPGTCKTTHYKYADYSTLAIQCTAVDELSTCMSLLHIKPNEALIDLAYTAHHKREFCSRPLSRWVYRNFC